MSLQWRREGKMRLLYTSGNNLTEAACSIGPPDKVYAVIGPFESHLDKAKLQHALLLIMRGYNVVSDQEEDGKSAST